MRQQQALSQVLDELVSAIEMRDVADPDSYDWTVDARIRTLERRLVDLRRAERDPYVIVIEEESPALAGMF
jgi:hypothetical protein